MKFVSLKLSSRDNKRYEIIFSEPKKTIHFGAKNYSDFTQHKSEIRKNAYLARHKVNENFNDPLTAGALSRWILWNKPTLSASVADFKKRFNL